jgi:hypothetical protein
MRASADMSLSSSPCDFGATAIDSRGSGNMIGGRTICAFESHNVSPVCVCASFATPPMSPQTISGAFTWSLPTM